MCLLQARDQVFKGTDISPSDVRVHVRGTSAFVTCTEEVCAPSGNMHARTHARTHARAQLRTC
jgi:hypothetical protein